MSTPQWFAKVASKGLYVVEYRLRGGDFDVWIKWRRGFWERALCVSVSGFFVRYADTAGRDFLPSNETIPEADLRVLLQGVRSGWHQEPPAEFFAVRCPGEDG